MSIEELYYRDIYEIFRRICSLKIFLHKEKCCDNCIFKNCNICNYDDFNFKDENKIKDLKEVEKIIIKTIDK